MNFLKNRSLKRLALYLLGAMFLVLMAEYFTIRYKIEILEEVEEKKDFVRGAQLEGQQVALLVQQYLAGEKHLSADIASRLTQQDHVLTTLRDGGRIDETDVFLKPLSRLPRISFDQLQTAWTRYRDDVTSLLTDLPQTTVSTDSSAVVTLPPSDRAKTLTLLPARWLTLSNWYKKLEADLTDEANDRKTGVEVWVFIFIFFDLLLLAALFYLFDRFVLNPILSLKENTIQQQQHAELPENEIGELNREVNEVLEQLKDATEFVGAIGEGKLDFDYRTLDHHYAAGRNKLADSLIAMQAKLRDMSLEEQRRQWANEGLTKFVDILRSANDNMSTLGDKIISALVQYTGSNQGGLYVINDEDPNHKYLELISLFAFNTKKFDKQKIRLGEGILGQTFLEKETTLLTEIPEEYIRITSGLGEANPKAILMVPLKVDQEVYGIVELASFKNYQQHEIAFVEKLAETIASTLASVKVAQKNRQLIDQFHEKTEQMRAQEEEMRQSVEELQATQEEMARKEREMGGVLESREKFKQDIIGILNQIPAKVFLKDSQGNMILCNEAVAEGYHLPVEKIIGTHDRDHFDPEQVRVWDAQEKEIMRDGKKTYIQEERIHNKVRYLKTTKMPFTIRHLNEIGLMGFQIDVTDTMQQGKTQSDDWALAEEVEKTLRLQLDALRLVHPESNGK